MGRGLRTAEVPADALAADGLQTIALTHTKSGATERESPVRLHRLRWR